MDKKQLGRLSLLFLVLAVIFWIDNGLYGCNPGERDIGTEQLPLSEYNISCLVNREINASFTIFCFALFIGFGILTLLEPKEKK